MRATPCCTSVFRMSGTALPRAEDLGGSRVMGPVTSPTGLRVRHFKDPERNLIGVAGSCNDAHLSCGLGRGLEDRRGTQRRRFASGA